MRPWPGTHLDLDIAGAGDVARALTGSDTAARRTSTAFRKRAQDDSQRPRRRRSGRKGRDVITCGLGGARVVLRDLENHSFQTLAPPTPALAAGASRGTMPVHSSEAAGHLTSSLVPSQPAPHPPRRRRPCPSGLGRAPCSPSAQTERGQVCASGMRR